MTSCLILRHDANTRQTMYRINLRVSTYGSQAKSEGQYENIIWYLCLFTYLFAYTLHFNPLPDRLILESTSMHFVY